jgi:TolB-like protein/DNA-binding winged helix-turn-helix (wHTH) protein/Tfp pilus assembly protein PilF
MPLSSAQVTRFGEYELDHRAGELRKGGLRIRLQEQPLQVLQALLDNPGQVVTREELQKRIWPADTFVDFDHGLHAAVNRLRAALNDSADRPRYVETVARRGYRFIGQIESAPAPNQSQTQTRDEHAGSSSPVLSSPRSRLRTPIVVFAGALAVVVMLATLSLNPVRHGMVWLFSPATARSFRSLAVLPLDNLSGDPKQDYFADGMTDELINQLSKIGNLRVISRTSVMQYKGTKKSLPRIAGELNVDAVIEGAVRLDGSHVRISAQLVNASTEQRIWGDEYDRELSNVLLLQSDVASDITKQIDLQLTPQQQMRLQAGARPVDPEAYQSYLLGRYYWNLRTAESLDSARKYFGAAIQKDPNFALAYSGLADYFAYLTVLGGPEVLKPHDAMQQARAAASKALQLNDSLAEAHASLGNILHNYDWDWAGAEREYKRAIELNPNYATAHHLYAHLLIETGHTQESLAEARRALELDPYSPFVNNGVSRLYYLSRQYDKAIAQCQLGLQINPAYLPARIQLALAYEQTGKLAEAISQLEEAAGRTPNAKGQRLDLPVLHGLLGHAYAVAGRNAEARKELAAMQAAAASRYVPPSYLAIVWMALGDKDQALSWLSRAYQDRSEHNLYLGLEPLVDPLRSDPRFLALIKNIGLPASARH